MCQYGAHSSDTNEVVNDDEISELIKQRENVSKMLSNFKPNFKLETTDHLCLHEKSLIISLEDKISELKKPISN